MTIPRLFFFTLKKINNGNSPQLMTFAMPINRTAFGLSQHALSINGKRKEINLDDLLIVGKSMNIKNAKEIVKQVNNTVAQWERYADIVQVNPKKAKAIKDTLIRLKID